MKLEPTAAFVMKLASDLFKKDTLTKEFLNQLDLSSASELIQDHQREGIFQLTQESMCNRKFTVRQCLMNLVDQMEAPVQIVILAAGKSPLALELLHRRRDKIKKVFEVDITPFEEKKSVYGRLAPSLRDHVAFIEQDICSAKLRTDMKKQGFDPDAPSVIVMEGITHYIPKKKFEQCLSRFVSKGRKNRVIIEYGPPLETLASWVQPKAEKVYELIEKRYFSQGVIKHTPREIGEILEDQGGRLIKHYAMNEMEYLRKGKNEFFHEPNSGWVELVLGEI